MPRSSRTGHLRFEAPPRQKRIITQNGRSQGSYIGIGDYNIHMRG